MNAHESRTKAFTNPPCVLKHERNHETATTKLQPRTATTNCNHERNHER